MKSDKIFHSRFLASAAIIWILVVSISSAAPFAYITNTGNNTVSVIDTAINNVTVTVPVGTAPYGVAVSPDGSKAYIVNQGNNTVSVIDTFTNNVIANVTVGSIPLGVAVTPDGTKVYVTNENSNNVSVIDTATYNVTATIPVDADPSGVAVHPDGTKVYVVDTASDTVSVINTTTNNVTATVNGLAHPFGVAVTPDGTKVYVTNVVDNTVSVIDTFTNNVTATVPVGINPFGVAVTPDGTKVYVANINSNNVSVIDTFTNNVTVTVPVGIAPYGIAVTPDGTKVYVANNKDNTVSVINTTSNNVTTIVPVGKGPIAFGQFITPSIPALTVNKLASPATYSTVGQVITYTYTVTNYGNVSISGPIIVTDNRTGTTQISSGGLSPGQNVTGTANYTITQADLCNGSVTNEAFATGIFNGTSINSANTTATVIATPIQNPSLLAIKLASTATYSTVGQNVTYTYIVVNPGTAKIDGPINVVDNRIGTTQISSSGLAPGQYVISTANYTITQADLDNGSVTNAAFATGKYNCTVIKSAEATATVTAIQNPNLITVKLASPATYNNVGQNITYTYTVTNSGNVGISGPISVTDNKTGTTQISSSGLAPDQNVTGIANYTITQADIRNGSVTNSAFSSGIFNGTVINSPNVTATVKATSKGPALTIFKSASQSVYFAIGQNVTYTYIVVNSGTERITGPINVVDNRTGTIQVSSSGLAPGQNVTGTANYTVTQADIENGSVTNAAFASGISNGTVINSASVIATVTAIQDPALITVKLAFPATYNAVGQNITYTYIVVNSGNVGISGPIIVTDNRTGTTQISRNSLAPGQHSIGTANYTITQADINNGSVTNSAFATGTYKGTVINSAEATATVTASQNPALLTVKVASPATYSTVGQSITYNYTVTNSGNVIISGPISVTDNRTGTAQISTSGLAPGQNVTGTANYTITQADIENGSVTNAAFASGIFNGTVINSASVTATVTAIRNPALLTVKVASPVTYSTAGQNITYSYIVVNSGNVGISGPINVTDNRTGTAQISTSGLAPGQFDISTANYTITQADIENGSVTNSAFASGIFNGTVINSTNATATVTALRSPSLTIVKLASPTIYSIVGQNVTYSYVIINSGNVGISGPISVTDNRTGTTQISSSGLAPDQLVTGTANYTITRADIDNGSVTNAAFASGIYNGTIINSTNATATVVAI